METIELRINYFLPDTEVTGCGCREVLVLKRKEKPTSTCKPDAIICIDELSWVAG